MSEKIKYLLCETPLWEGQFLLQAENPQILFQILVFKDAAQYADFLANCARPSAQIPGHNAALLTACALQDIGLRQDNAMDLYRDMEQVKEKAARWLSENAELEGNKFIIKREKKEHEKD